VAQVAPFGRWNEAKTAALIMEKSRSGKTVNWEFHCNFSGGIDF
jgi:hypothetical protein